MKKALLVQKVSTDQLLAEVLTERGFGVFFATRDDLKNKKVVATCLNGCKKSMKISDFDVIKSRSRLLIDVEKLLNPVGVRKISLDKIYQAELLGEYMPKTEIFNQSSGILANEKIVLKANRSFGKAMVEIGESVMVDEMLGRLNEKLEASKQEDKRVIIQEYVQGDAWSGLVAIDKNKQNDIDTALGREMRVYVFVSGEQVDFYVLGRMVVGDDHGWIYLKQDEGVSELKRLAGWAAEEIRHETREQYFFVAVDIIKNGEGLLIREVNTRDPAFVSVKENREVAEILANKMADLMEAIV